MDVGRQTEQHADMTIKGRALSRYSSYCASVWKVSGTENWKAPLFFECQLVTKLVLMHGVWMRRTCGNAIKIYFDVKKNLTVPCKTISLIKSNWFQTTKTSGSISSYQTLPGDDVSIGAGCTQICENQTKRKWGENIFSTLLWLTPPFDWHPISHVSRYQKLSTLGS